MSAEVLTTLQGTPQDGSNLPSGQATGLGDESQGQTPKIPDVLSILPVRSFVVFPGTVAPLNVQRPTSVKLLDETGEGTKLSLQAMA